MRWCAFFVFQEGSVATAVLTVSYEFGDGEFDVVGVVDVFELKTLTFGSSLNEDIAISEKSAKKTISFTGDILYLVEAQFGHGAREEAVLFNVDDAFCGDNPDVEEIVSDLSHGNDGDDQHVATEEQSEGRTPEWLAHDGEVTEFDSTPDDKGDDGHGEGKEKGAGQVEPEATKEKYGDLTAFLVWKGF